MSVISYFQLIDNYRGHFSKIWHYSSVWQISSSLNNNSCFLIFLHWEKGFSPTNPAPTKEILVHSHVITLSTLLYQTFQTVFVICVNWHDITKIFCHPLGTKVNLFQISMKFQQYTCVLYTGFTLFLFPVFFFLEVEAPKVTLLFLKKDEPSLHLTKNNLFHSYKIQSLIGSMSSWSSYLDKSLQFKPVATLRSWLSSWIL